MPRVVNAPAPASQKRRATRLRMSLVAQAGGRHDKHATRQLDPDELKRKMFIATYA